MTARLLVGAAALAVASSAQAQNFVNWESPHVHSLDITPDGTRLLAVNTPDNRLEVFDITGAAPVHLASISVGLDPVSVRARTNTEAWVVNHISDSVSVVNLTTQNVRATLFPGDEPTDVVFAAPGGNARAFVSVSQKNQIKVYDQLNLAAVPVTIALQGEEPRALTTDGVNIYAAIFESGNRTTVISKDVVSLAAGPYVGQNPPPNSGTKFVPPIADGLPAPPPVGLILHRVDAAWLDDNGHDWSAQVPWDVHDHDVAVINAATLEVSYVTGLMNLNMALAMRPDGHVTVVGTEALNRMRFEPNVNGIFIRAMLAVVDPLGKDSVAVADLNPHLDYSVPTVAQSVRDESIGDPRGIVWNASGSLGYVTGMGSDNLIIIDPGGGRVGLINVGQGPTGLALSTDGARLFVLNKFEGSVSVIDVGRQTELTRVPMFDPTPQVIHDGRPMLYNTHLTSGLGQAACASCHVDARMDQLAWDLGNPAGQMQLVDQDLCSPLLPPPPFGSACIDFHPMKGPMSTQTLIGIVNAGPMHWRGDRANLVAFSPAFVSLMGDDEQPTAAQMSAFHAFVDTIRFPPQPNRTIVNGLPISVPGFSGSPTSGQALFGQIDLVGGLRACAACHVQISGGTNGRLIPATFLGEVQTFKVPHLRNMYEKMGFSKSSLDSNMGFGILHDGSEDTIFAFLQRPIFTFAAGAAGDQQRRDLEAFLMTFPSDTHAAVGMQATANGLNNNNAVLVNQLNTFASISNTPAAKMVAKGIVNGEVRGWAYLAGSVFQSDRAAETITLATLRQSATVGGEITFTVVPNGSETRIGIDRDGDGFFDRDELDAGSDPADPDDVPGGPPCPADLNNDDVVDGLDIGVLLAAWGGTGPADLNGDAIVDGLDIGVLLAAWGTCP